MWPLIRGILVGIGVFIVTINIANHDWLKFCNTLAGMLLIVFVLDTEE